MKVQIRYILIIFTFLLSILMYIDRACIGASKNDICGDFKLTNIQWAWIMAIFTLGYALFQTPIGKLSDKKGPRGVLTLIITLWSIFTTMTGMVFNFISLLFVRFLFGAGEAGTFPTFSKVIYKWYPIQERGIMQSINFSGSRIGGAIAYPIVVMLITLVGWRMCFVFAGCLGFIFAIIWFLFYRNSPEESKLISINEKEYILLNRQKNDSNLVKNIPIMQMFKSFDVQLLMIQYIGSNFTFYFTLTWMFPYLKEALKSSAYSVGFMAMVPLLGGAFGNWFSGFLVDYIYKRGNLILSRRLPAILGFTLTIVGLLMMIRAGSDFDKIIYLTIAIFGADMTLSPSWSFCIDIGKENAGSVSGIMNMAGNIGAFASILTFGYMADWLISKGIDPKLALAGNDLFFYICITLSVVSIIAWIFINPKNNLNNI